MVCKRTPKPPVASKEIQTVRASTVDGLCLADSPTILGGRSGQHLPTKNIRQTDRTKDAQELAKNMMNSLLSPTSRTVRMDHADGLLGTGTTTRAQPFEGQLLFPFVWSLKSAKGKLPNHRGR
jgi:hypothetical protein